MFTRTSSRHALATSILAAGGSEQDVADVLGISAAVVRKHYAKWSQARQEWISRIMEMVHGTAFDSGIIAVHTGKIGRS